MSAAAVLPFELADMSIVNTTLDDREAVRCRSCSLNQFYKREGQLCCRCHKRLVDPPQPAAPPRLVLVEGKPSRICDRIGRRLQLIREYKGYSQRTLAHHMGVPRTYLSKYENAVCVPNLSQLRRICNALGITMEELLSEAKHPAELARDTMDEGGPDEEVMAALVEALPRLDHQARRILARTAKQLHHGQLTFKEWMVV